VLCSMDKFGIRAYCTLSFPTTLSIKRIWRWHHPRCYKVIGAEPHCFGIKQENKNFGPDILQKAEIQVHIVKEKFRIAQSRQKSYANHRRRELSFEVGDYVYLKVLTMQGL
jgi:hypothetical protein